MPFLLDTMVISEIRRKNRNKKVVEWIASIPADSFFLSAIMIGEIENGTIRQQVYLSLTLLNNRFNSHVLSTLE